MTGENRKGISRDDVKAIVLALKFTDIMMLGAGRKEIRDEVAGVYTRLSAKLSDEEAETARLLAGGLCGQVLNEANKGGDETLMMENADLRNQISVLHAQLQQLQAGTVTHTGAPAPRPARQPRIPRESGPKVQGSRGAATPRPRARTKWAQELDDLYEACGSDNAGTQGFPPKWNSTLTDSQNVAKLLLWVRRDARYTYLFEKRRARALGKCLRLWMTIQAPQGGIDAVEQHRHRIGNEEYKSYEAVTMRFLDKYHPDKKEEK